MFLMLCILVTWKVWPCDLDSVKNLNLTKSNWFNTSWIWLMFGFYTVACSHKSKSQLINIKTQGNKVLTPYLVLTPWFIGVDNECSHQTLLGLHPYSALLQLYKGIYRGGVMLISQVLVHRGDNKKSNVGGNSNKSWH